MHLFFPESYPDELLYSICARYHYYTGNLNYKETANQLFGTKNYIPNVLLASHLDFFCKQFYKGKYSPSKLLDDYTLFPFYIPFIPKERMYKIERQMRYSNANGIYNSMGLAAGNICGKELLYYCPLCIIEDVEKYGESYFRRLHQLSGIDICLLHKCKLKAYPDSKKNRSRLEFIRLDLKRIREVEYNIEYTTSNTKIQIAEAMFFLLSTDLRVYNSERVISIYREIFQCRGWITIKGRIRKKQLKSELIGFYGEDLLNSYESNVSLHSGYTWLDKLFYSKSTMVHPIRHILLIHFLGIDVSEFFNNYSIDCRPFGCGAWPCLNPVADHFHQNTIEKVKITSSEILGKVVGTFRCECGFEYSRTGPDKGNEDRYRIGRVKEYGDLWEMKLSQLSKAEKSSIRNLSRKMKCDPMTIKHHLNNSPPKSKQTKLNEQSYKDYLEEHKSNIEALIVLNSDITRNEIKTQIPSDYYWLYRNERTILYDILPPPVNNRKKSLRVNWAQRDIEVKAKIKSSFENLIKYVPTIRITKTRLGKYAGIQSVILSKLEYLPVTNDYLNDVCETLEDFHIRKIKKICRFYIETNKEIKEWEVKRLSGIKNELTPKERELILLFSRKKY